MKSNECIPFKVSNGLSSSLYLELEEQGRKYGWDSIHTIEVQSIVVAHWVRLKCRFGCTHFNTNWCCPPATPEPDEVRRILSEYSSALLLVGTHRNPGFYNNKTRSRAGQVRLWKATVSLERMLFLRGYYKAFSLISGPCPLCKSCGYSSACKMPTYRRPSAESFSIDFIETLQNVGLSSNVAMDTRQSFNFYSLILME